MNDLWESNKKEINVDLTPLIDIIFLLIIFFMVTTTFDKYGGAQLNLPKSKLQEVNDKKANLSLLIDKKKNLVLKLNYEKNSKDIITNLEDVDKNIKNILSNVNDKTLNILSDESVEYGYIISIIEKAKLSGIEKINLETAKNN
ncbi:MAG: biopolymer transporter ExbD [Fusobacteriaceae bacterium]|nr:biopolymer transporter ExbD [Fusobacteriaceae bacterium]